MFWNFWFFCCQHPTLMYTMRQSIIYGTNFLLILFFPFAIVLGQLKFHKMFRCENTDWTIIEIQIQKGFQPIVTILCCWTYFLCQECKLLSRNRDFLLLYCIHFTWAGYCSFRYHNQIPPHLFLGYHTFCGLLLFVSEFSKTYRTKQNNIPTKRLKWL